MAAEAWCAAWELEALEYAGIPARLTQVRPWYREGAMGMKRSAGCLGCFLILQAAHLGHHHTKLYITTCPGIWQVRGMSSDVVCILN